MKGTPASSEKSPLHKASAARAIPRMFARNLPLYPYTLGRRERKIRFRVYEEAPGFHPGPITLGRRVLPPGLATRSLTVAHRVSTSDQFTRKHSPHPPPWPYSRRDTFPWENLPKHMHVRERTWR
jgi:hypothetical protein